MPNIEGQKNWSPIRLLETHELARGGLNGNLNEQAKALADRTEFLNQEKANKSEIIKGHFSFNTLAEFEAKKLTIPANSTVMIAEAGLNQGENIWNGTNLSKSPYDPVSLIPVISQQRIDQGASDLFKKSSGISANANMLVKRFLNDGATTDYIAGTYQTLNITKVAIAVTPSGSNATKHYFRTGAQLVNFTAELKVNTIRTATSGESIGIGIFDGTNYSVITYSESGNVLQLANQVTTTMASGLGGYAVGDIIKFVAQNNELKIYLNDVLKHTRGFAFSGEIVIGQGGFTYFESFIYENSSDPIRDYVKKELAKIPTPDPTVLPQAISYTESYVQDRSVDLFKKTVAIPYLNNMPVTRFTAVATSNTYASGTYQSLNGLKVNLAVLKAGSSAIKHYFVSGIAAQTLTAEFKVTLQDIAGDTLGIGFKNGENYNVIALSNSGNLSTISGYTNTVVSSGLGGYGVGDTVKFELLGSTVKVYVNGVFKAQHILASTAGVIIIGQGGFSQYESSIIGASSDPIREYVQAKIAEVAKNGLSKCYYSFDVGVAPLLGTFKAYVQIKNDLYVGFDVKHEYNISDLLYQNYWRIYQALIYKFEKGIMQPTGKIALGTGESEFVFKQNATKVDFTGGYHGDEIVADVKFLADGLLIGTTANIPLTACEQFEYIEKSTLHETATAEGVIAGHPIIAYHMKHTVFKNSGYKTKNLVTWNYDGLLTLIYHGIACIHKDISTTVFSDDTYTDQVMASSGNNYFNALGARLYKGRNELNGFAVEASAYQVTPDDADLNSEFFVHDRSTDSKYYRKSPAKTVTVGEKHESYFECKFFCI